MMPRRIPEARSRPVEAPVPTRTRRRDLLDDEVDVAVRAFGVDLHWQPRALFVTAAAIAGLIGSTIAGPVGFGVAVLAFLAACLGLLRAARRRHAALALATLPEVCLRLSRALRAGRPIEDAVVAVVGDVRPVVPGLRAAAGRVAAGAPIDDAFRRWLLSAESGAERLLSAALLLGVGRGAQLAGALDVVGEGIRDDLDLSSRRRVLLAQATMSATVLVLLPVGFALVASMMRGRWLYEGRVGVSLAAAGLFLDGLGCLWIRRSMRRLR